MKVLAVVFDLGKVLVDFDYGVAARALAGQSSASADAIRTCINQSPLLLRYESAGITTQEFFETVRDRIGFHGSFDQFAAAFADIFTENTAMVRFQAELSRQDLSTFVLSNTNEIAVGHIRRSFPFFANFSDYILSYEHGALKPQERIYEIAEQRTGCRGGEIVFIDDRPENVAAAARRHWRTVCHRSPEESIARVRSWLS